MIKRVYLLLTFILLLTSYQKAEAQHEIRIQGVVRDVTTNSPIGGVSIIYNGGQVALTDVDVALVGRATILSRRMSSALRLILYEISFTM